MTKQTKIIIGLSVALLLAIGIIVGILLSAGSGDSPSTDKVDSKDDIDPTWTKVEMASASMSAENALPDYQADAIEIGDIVYLDNTPADEIEIGDVIGFWEGDIIVIHKVYSITEAGASESGQREFITFGINNWGIDTDEDGKAVRKQALDLEPVLAENLIGRVVHRKPSFKSILVD